MRLEIRGLEFSYGDNKILKNISFDIIDGEFIGLMGPNGSGKTTLLRCLTRYLPSAARTVLVDMKPLHTLSEKEIARTFAVVPQSSSTDFPFTVRDIVSMGRLPHVNGGFGRLSGKDSAAVENAMEVAGCARFAHRRFSALSGGERQRVVIARALAQEPKALLLDEPTVYLDISGQFEMMDLVRRLNKEMGLSIVAVLHDINLAARYSDRIALLNQGLLEAIGPPSEVLTPGIIEDVYGVDVAVKLDPFTNAVYVMPRSRKAKIARHGTRVHVLCGGGTGALFMKELIDNGFAVSAGVVNVLDSDYEFARDMHVPVAAEVPFAQISNEAFEENLRLLEEATCVVVTPFPVGPGNYRNLDAAEEALSRGKRVIVVTGDDPLKTDFVGGKAAEAVKGLINSGAIEVKDVKGVLEEMSKSVAGR